MPRPYSCVYSSLDDPDWIEVGLLRPDDMFALDGKKFVILANADNRYVLVKELDHVNTCHLSESVLVKKIN
jgi:hypothetical protein